MSKAVATGREVQPRATPRPLGRAFATVPDMPPDCDLGALLAELMKLKLFVVERSDDGAMLAPAEFATAKAEPSKAEARKAYDTVAAKVPADLAERARAKARQGGVSLSALIATALAAFVESD